MINYDKCTACNGALTKLHRFKELKECVECGGIHGKITLIEYFRLFDDGNIHDPDPDKPMPTYFDIVIGAGGERVHGWKQGRRVIQYG